MGSSGCGKTTLINCIVGISRLDAGEIKIFGKPKLKNFRFGYMPQESALVESFKIREMLWFFGVVYGLTPSEINAKVEMMKNLLDLPDDEMLIRNCSGGQQRRVSIAVALIHDPELLILDEPTAGLDPLLRERVWNHLIELASVKNVTVLLSTHYIEEAKLSHCIGLMRNGVLIAENSPTEIMRACNTTNMDEAFLELSQIQSTCRGVSDLSIQSHAEDDASSEFKPSKLRQSQQMVIAALLRKLFIFYSRNLE
jgi:ABC-type multidrug transport system ATPase subunit